MTDSAAPPRPGPRPGQPAGAANAQGEARARAHASPRAPLPQTPPKFHLRLGRRRRFGSLRAIGALMLREMTTTYGRSPGGYVWKIAEPVGGIILLTLAFSLFLRQPSLGRSFPLFYATGLLPFTTFLTLSNVVSQSLNFSRPLLAYPAVTWADAIIARFLLNFLTEMMVIYLVLGGILLVSDTRTIIDLPVIALALLLSGCLGLGFGILNCYLFTRFQMTQRVWSIAMRPMFLISGVMFIYETIPLPWRDYLWWNPILQIVGLMRRGFYASYDAPYVSITYILVLSGVTSVVGLILLSRYHRLLLNL